jgi:hypothetical protein
MHEYIVTVHDPKDWDQLWDQITIDGRSDTYVPARAIEVLNERPLNDYSAHFNLTHDEADLLAHDPRVLAVEQQADSQDHIEKTFGEYRTGGTYDRSGSAIDPAMRNWGLLRCISGTDPFIARNRANPPTSITTDLPYVLDGTGVDIIVMDSGVEPNHPEFAVNIDGSGGSRVVNFDWGSLGVPGVASAASIGGYLGDSDGHGSNCASIAAGNTCGWAPGAAIYSIRIFAGKDITTGATLGAINSDVAYDLIKKFHLMKIAAGNTRPTIVNNSWAYTSSYAGMQSTKWHGQNFMITAPSVKYGQLSNYNSHGVQLAYVDTSVNNCAAAGVILVAAAGNNGHKIDVTNGPDYNNYYVKRDSTGKLINTYYHRGSSPGSAYTMISVGAFQHTAGFNGLTEAKAPFSCSGPRVDIYAPGVMIMGAYGNKKYVLDAVPDSRNPNYYRNKETGTSQASPQVAGALACLLQLRPDTTYLVAKQFLYDYCQTTLDELTAAYAKGTTYGNPYMLQGGVNRMLYQPFNGGSNAQVPARGYIGRLFGQ